MRELRDLCAQADRLHKSARDLCKRLSAQLDALEAPSGAAKAHKAKAHKTTRRPPKGPTAKGGPRNV